MANKKDPPMEVTSLRLSSDDMGKLLETAKYNGVDKSGQIRILIHKEHQAMKRKLRNS